MKKIQDLKIFIELEKMQQGLFGWNLIISVEEMKKEIVLYVLKKDKNLKKIIFIIMILKKIKYSNKFNISIN